MQKMYHHTPPVFCKRFDSRKPVFLIRLHTVSAWPSARHLMALNKHLSGMYPPFNSIGESHCIHAVFSYWPGLGTDFQCVQLTHYFLWDCLDRAVGGLISKQETDTPPSWRSGLANWVVFLFRRRSNGHCQQPWGGLPLPRAEWWSW